MTNKWDLKCENDLTVSEFFKVQLLISKLIIANLSAALRTEPIFLLLTSSFFLLFGQFIVNRKKYQLLPDDFQPRLRSLKTKNGLCMRLILFSL